MIWEILAYFGVGVGCPLLGWGVLSVHRLATSVKMLAYTVSYQEKACKTNREWCQSDRSQRWGRCDARLREVETDLKHHLENHSTGATT